MKRLFLTGGDGGIGSAIKEKFLENGYDVIAPDLHELDLSDPVNTDEYFTKNPATFDVIVHCAGYNRPLDISDISEAEYSKTQNINLNSFIRIVQHNIPYFKKKGGGHVLGIASLYGEISREKRLSYAVSKHGLIGAVQTMALELGTYRVCCNTLSPGFVDTPLTRQNLTPENIALIASKIPMGGLTTPREIANTAFFLCSSENTAISGQNIIVDGGYMAGGFQR